MTGKLESQLRIDKLKVSKLSWPKRGRAFAENVVALVVIPVEFVLIPVMLVLVFGWVWAIAVFVGYILLRPKTGYYAGTSFATVTTTIIDSLFTLGIAIFSFYRGYWIPGSILVLYGIANWALTRVAPKPPEVK